MRLKLLTETVTAAKLDKPALRDVHRDQYYGAFKQSGSESAKAGVTAPVPGLPARYVLPRMAERPLVRDAEITLHYTGELHAFFDHFARDSRRDRAVGLLEQIVVEHVNFE